MADTGYITRANMPSPYPTSHLDLFTPYAMPADQSIPIYDFVENGLDPGTPQKRRQIAESMYVVGASQLSSSFGMGEGHLAMFVTGTDLTTLNDSIDALVLAVTLQDSWELHVSAGGGPERAWTFWDADQPTVGFAVTWWKGVYAPVTITAPRYPIPLEGAV